MQPVEHETEPVASYLAEPLGKTLEQAMVRGSGQ